MRLRRNVPGEPIDNKNRTEIPVVPHNSSTIAEPTSPAEPCSCISDDSPQCADFALHVSLVVFLSFILVSCVYVCKKPTRRKAMKSTAVQTDDIEIYDKENSSSTPSSSPPLERPKLQRHYSEQVRQNSSLDPLKTLIPPSPLATSDLTNSVCSLQSTTSSHPVRNPKKVLRKANTMIAFPTNLLANDSYKQLTSTTTISSAKSDKSDTNPQLDKRRRITVAGRPPSFHQNLLLSNNHNLGSSLKHGYKPISTVHSTSDGDLSKREEKAAKKTEEIRFTRRMD